MNNYFKSTVRLRFTSADPVGIITKLTDKGIILRDFNLVDDLTAFILVNYIDKYSVIRILSADDISFTIAEESGFLCYALRLLHRPILVIGLSLFILLTLIIPNRIFFISVEGNRNVSSEMILSVSEELGLCFGSLRNDIRSEKLKNYLLEKIPQLQWVGVNSRGCVATISVKEREHTDHTNHATDLCGVVAGRDGIIRQMTVRSGFPLCRVGQSVRCGQVLVSPFEDCGICIRAKRADAEIFADTVRQITAKTATDYSTKREIIASEKKYSVVFGKKRINLFKDTGISDTGCVKMYKEYYMKLPGGFTLPLAIIECTETVYKTETVSLTEPDLKDWVFNEADRYIQKEMIAGRILGRDATLFLADGTCTYRGVYTCFEMIGQLRSEENYIENE